MTFAVDCPSSFKRQKHHSPRSKKACQSERRFLSSERVTVAVPEGVEWSHSYNLISVPVVYTNKVVYRRWL